MSYLSACVFLALVALITSKVTYRNYVTNYEILFKKDYPNKCVMETSAGQFIMNKDETKRYPGKCADVYCGRNGWALVYECEPQTPPIGCVFTEYIYSEAPFPECCERKVKCNLV